MRWPPDTFLADKLAGLASAGLRVTVASRERAPGHGPAGVELMALPAVGDRSPAAAARAAADVCRLALRHPGKLRRLVRAVRARGHRRSRRSR